MAINFQQVKQTLYDWAISQVPTGMPVIFYQPNAPRPNQPYVTLYIVSVVQVNQDWSSDEANDDGEIDMHGDRQFTLQVEAYGGDDVLTLLENMRTSLQKQTVLDILRAGGVVFYSSLAINDITNLVDSQFERRAQFDTLLGIGQVYIDNPGYFNQIEIEEIISDGVNIVYDETITITAP